MIVRHGPHVHDSDIGPLHCDRRLDATQVALVAAAIRLVGWSPGRVTEVELVEGAWSVRGWDTDDEARVRGEVVRRVTYGGTGAALVPA